jgi:hypothetical protein
MARSSLSKIGLSIKLGNHVDGSNCDNCICAIDASLQCFMIQRSMTCKFVPGTSNVRSVSIDGRSNGVFKYSIDDVQIYSSLSFFFAVIHELVMRSSGLGTKNFVKQHHLVFIGWLRRLHARKMHPKASESCSTCSMFLLTEI